MREPPREDDAHPDVHASVNPACRKQSQHFSLDSKTPGACHRGVKCDAGQQPDKQPPWTSARWQGRYPGCAACLLACKQSQHTNQGTTLAGYQRHASSLPDAGPGNHASSHLATKSSPTRYCYLARAVAGTPGQPFEPKRITLPRRGIQSDDQVLQRGGAPPAMKTWNGAWVSRATAPSRTSVRRIISSMAQS